MARKKCKICRSPKHDKDDCPCLVDECSKGDVCKKWCMVDLSIKLQRISRKLRRASEYDDMQDALEKLEDFEHDLECAYDWLDDHKGIRRKSCSSRKKVCMFQKACQKLRDAYEDKFDSESSDDDEWCYTVPLSHKEGIQKLEVEKVPEADGQNRMEKSFEIESQSVEDFRDPGNAIHRDVESKIQQLEDAKEVGDTKLKLKRD